MPSPQVVVLPPSVVEGPVTQSPSMQTLPSLQGPLQPQLVLSVRWSEGKQELPDEVPLSSVSPAQASEKETAVKKRSAVR